MTPRAPVASSYADAARAAAWFLLGGGALCAVLTVVAPQWTDGPASYVTTLVFSALMLLTGVVCLRRPDRLPASFWVTAPVLVAIAVVVLNLLAGDASTGSQLFLLWPVLFTASFLSLRATVTVLLVVSGAELLLTFLLLAPAEAVTDSVSMIGSFGLSAVVITGLRRRVDRLVAALREQATTDLLTGLPNRRALETGLADALAGSQRTGDALAVLLVDVDSFKSVNDSGGHAAGDAVLRSVADALRAAARDGDTLGRLGGDEFAMVFRGCSTTDAVSRADGVRLSLEDVTVSIGVAGAQPGDDEDALLRRADAALYAAKAAGRDAVAVAGP